MDDLVVMLAGATFLLVVNFVIKAFLYRVKKGNFKRFGSSREGGAIGFETDLGRFILSPSKKALFYDGPGGSDLRFSFSEIERVAFHHSDDVSWLGEAVFGLDLWDVFTSNRDSVQWHQLTLEMTGGTEVPVFVAGQYVRREIFLNWWFEFERDFLQKIGALEPLEDRLWQVSHEIEGMLRDVGSLEERN